MTGRDVPGDSAPCEEADPTTLKGNEIQLVTDCDDICWGMRAAYTNKCSTRFDQDVPCREPLELVFLLFDGEVAAAAPLLSLTLESGACRSRLVRKAERKAA